MIRLRSKLLPVLTPLGLTAVIALFFSPFLFSNNILPSDWDYFAQIYEAARMSILQFHQFPWWNAWQMGGIPLYANPQFGLFSIEMLLVLLFGTLSGLKFALLLYAIAGFWGMRKLLMRLRTGQWRATVLSYIWIFSAFPIWHFSVGHFTFATYMLAPWLFLFLLDVQKRSHNWLYVVLVATIAIQSSFHYTTIQTFVVASILALAMLVKCYLLSRATFKELLVTYTKMGLLVLLVNAHKVYHGLAYLHDYPRIPITEERTPLGLLYDSLLVRGDRIVDTAGIFHVPYAWHEYTAYFGVITLALFVFLLIHKLLKKFKFDYFWLFAGVALFALALSLGPFMHVSPYALLKELPGFEQMQVATRWLGWAAFFIILSLHALPKKKVITMLLLVSMFDVMHSSFGVINRPTPQYHPVAKQQSFNQYSYFTGDKATENQNMRLFKTTQANLGEVYGYEPILGFGGDYNESKYDAVTLRCGVNRGCPFIKTNNAVLLSWSPNKIVLQRNAPGKIELNMNPGSNWKINGSHTFDGMRIVELNKAFIVMDPSSIITLTTK